MQIFLGPVSSWTSTSANFSSIKIWHFSIVFCPELNQSFKIFPLFHIIVFYIKMLSGGTFYRTFNDIFPCCRLFKSIANKHPLFNRLYSSHTLSTHYLWLITHDQVLVSCSRIAKSLKPSMPASVHNKDLQFFTYYPTRCTAWLWMHLWVLHWKLLLTNTRIMKFQ